VINRDSYDYIKLTSQTFDIIILDPPYRYNHIANILPFAAKKLRDGGIIICEYETEADEPAAPEGMRLRKTYRYGKINVSIFCKPSEEVADE
jgi:16S rRNA G966 N2-methylase RsmD